MWYIANIRRGSENLVQTLCARLAVEVYSPRMVVPKGGRTNLEPLFPSYVFCGVDLEADRIAALQRMPGVKYLLGSDFPLPVSDSVVGHLKDKVDEWNGGGWFDAFQPSAVVQVAKGPLRGLEAIFQGYVKARERCRILISLLSRPLTVEVDVRSLQHPNLGAQFGSAS